MKTTKIRPLSAVPFGFPVAEPSWSPTGVAAVVLAGTAALGRAASFIAAGPSSLSTLLLILMVAVAARTFATRVTTTPWSSETETKLVRMAKRIATVQIIMSVGLIFLTVF
jgi:hypothetical protein